MVEYKITSIRKVVDMTSAGKFVRKYRVYYVFKDIEDYVEVEEDKYSADYVKKLIEERVKEHEKLLSMR